MTRDSRVPCRVRLRQQRSSQGREASAHAGLDRRQKVGRSLGRVPSLSLSRKARTARYTPVSAARVRESGRNGRTGVARTDAGEKKRRLRDRMGMTLKGECVVGGGEAVESDVAIGRSEVDIGEEEGAAGRRDTGEKECECWELEDRSQQARTMRHQPGKQFEAGPTITARRDRATRSAQSRHS